MLMAFYDIDAGRLPSADAGGKWKPVARRLTVGISAAACRAPDPGRHKPDPGGLEVLRNLRAFYNNERPSGCLLDGGLFLFPQSVEPGTDAIFHTGDE